MLDILCGVEIVPYLFVESSQILGVAMGAHSQDHLLVLKVHQELVTRAHVELLSSFLRNDYLILAADGDSDHSSRTPHFTLSLFT